MSMCWCSFWRC